MAAPDTETALRAAATLHGLYVPSGAFWGGEDIKKMADTGALQVSYLSCMDDQLILLICDTSFLIVIMFK